MDLKELIKLDRKLGDKYCLFPLPNDKWTLGRTGTQREIMNSDKNTKEELLKFVKEHRTYNIAKCINNTCLIINSMWLLILIANLFIGSTLLRHMFWGAIFTIIPILIVMERVLNNNIKISKKVTDEDVEYFYTLQKEIVKQAYNTTKAAKSSKKVANGSTKPKTRKTSTKGEEKKEN